MLKSSFYNFLDCICHKMDLIIWFKIIWIKTRILIWNVCVVLALILVVFAIFCIEMNINRLIV